MRYMKGSFFIFLFIMLIISMGCSNEAGGKKKDEGEDTIKQLTDTVLNVAIDTAPPNLDQPTSTSASTRDASRLIFESLITTDKDFKPIEMLAEEVTVSDGGTVYTFHLRKGIEFHNGKEMIAEDVVASMERWEEKTALSGQIFDEATWEEKDDYTVVLTLAKPSPLTLDTIATSKHAPAIMPKEIVESAPAEGVTEYIGTGPYKLVEWKESQYIHFTRNENYKALDTEPNGLSGRKEALIKDIYIHIVPDSSTRLAGLLSGEYDFIYGVPKDNYDKVLDTDDVDVILAPGSNTFVKFNNVEGIVSDIEFRRILNTALDYEALMIAGFGRKEFFWLDPGYMHKDVAAWASKAGSEYFNINDPEKAKQMLDDYGYNGEEVVILVTRDFEYMYNIGVAVDEQLKKIGINTRLDVFDYPTSSDRTNKPEYWDIVVQGLTMVSTPPQVLTLSATWAGGVNNPKIQEDLKAIEFADSLEEAYKLWDDLQQYVWEEHLPIINLGGSNGIYGISHKLKGVEMSTIGPVYWNATIDE